jgi:hypothetical protein
MRADQKARGKIEFLNLLFRTPKDLLLAKISFEDQVSSRG